MAIAPRDRRHRGGKRQGRAGDAVSEPARLVEHRFRASLVCHHCGHVESRPHLCPQCHEADTLTACGPGVERLAEEAEVLFPDIRTLVLSSDTPGGIDTLRGQLD